MITFYHSWLFLLYVPITEKRSKINKNVQCYYQKENRNSTSLWKVFEKWHLTLHDTARRQRSVRVRVRGYAFRCHPNQQSRVFRDRAEGRERECIVRYFAKMHCFSITRRVATRVSIHYKAQSDVSERCFRMDDTKHLGKHVIYQKQSLFYLLFLISLIRLQELQYMDGPFILKVG